MTRHNALPRATIATVKTRGGKDAHAAITLHVPLDEAYGRAAAFLAACQELDCVVSISVDIIEEQASFAALRRAGVSAEALP